MGFYRKKIGPFLAEIWPKTSRKASMLGVKRGGGALIGGGALNGEFTVSHLGSLFIFLFLLYFDCMRIPWILRDSLYSHVCFFIMMYMFLYYDVHVFVLKQLLLNLEILSRGHHTTSTRHISCLAYNAVSLLYVILINHHMPLVLYQGSPFYLPLYEM